MDFSKIDLCPYKNIFGKPNAGIHKYRFLNIAIVDFIETVIAAWILSYFLKYPFWQILLGLFIVGIILHRLFCVRTTIDKLLFPYSESNYFS